MARRKAAKKSTRGKGTRTVRKLKQHGKSNTRKDRKLRALAPGKRRTASGTTYWETRKNRSDKGGKSAKKGTKRAV